MATHAQAALHTSQKEDCAVPAAEITASAATQGLRGRMHRLAVLGHYSDRPLHLSWASRLCIRSQDLAADHSQVSVQIKFVKRIVQNS